VHNIFLILSNYTKLYIKIALQDDMNMILQTYGYSGSDP